MEAAGPRVNEIRVTDTVSRVSETQAWETQVRDGRDSARATIRRNVSSSKVDLSS